MQKNKTNGNYQRNLNKFATVLPVQIFLRNFAKNWNFKQMKNCFFPKFLMPNSSKINRKTINNDNTDEKFSAANDKNQYQRWKTCSTTIIKQSTMNFCLEKLWHGMSKISAASRSSQFNRRSEPHCFLINLFRQRITMTNVTPDGIYHLLVPVEEKLQLIIWIKLNFSFKFLSLSVQQKNFCNFFCWK